MFRTATTTSPFPSFSLFRIPRKSSSDSKLDDFDLVARSFDEALLRRFKALDPPSITLSWLSLAVGFLSASHADAQALISNLKSPTTDDEDSITRYMDGSAKLLDVCNSISAEIERLRQRRLQINFALHLVASAVGDSKPPPPEKLRRARDLLSEWLSCPRSGNGNGNVNVSRRSGEASIDQLIRDLAADIQGRETRGKISEADRLVRRTFHAVGLFTVFVSGVLASALCGLPEPPPVHAPPEFPWSDSFNALESAVRCELNRGSGSEKEPVLQGLADVESRLRSLSDVIDESLGAGVDRKEALNNGVKGLATAMEPFSEGLDGLCNSVNEAFQTVLCSRNGMLGRFRV